MLQLKFSIFLRVGKILNKGGSFYSLYSLIKLIKQYPTEMLQEMHGKN